MKCFYHSDLDGKCAASIVAAFFSEAKFSDFIEVDYGQEFPFDLIEKGEQVIIVDWSLNQIELGWDKLISICGISNIIWIDHHATAIKNCPYILLGKQDTSEAACVLTYKYFYGNDVPLYIKLIGDHDTWKFNFGYKSWNMVNGLSIQYTHPKADIWKMLLDDKDIDSIMRNGYIITRYIYERNIFLADKLAFITKFEGYWAVVCNSPFSGAAVFESMRFLPNLQIVYKHDGRKFSVSLYNPRKNKDINCGEIAMKYRGGGHHDAAGFQCNNLPFKNLYTIEEWINLKQGEVI